MTDIETIAATLRAERKDQHLTLAQVASRCGVYLQHIHEWETCKIRPVSTNLITWADALGFEVQLVRKTDTEPESEPA